MIIKKKKPISLKDFTLDPIEWSKAVLGKQPEFDYITRVDKEPFLTLMKTMKPDEYGLMCLFGRLFGALSYSMRDDKWLEENYNRIFKQKLPDGRLDIESIKKTASEEYSGYFDVAEVTIDPSNPENDFDKSIRIVRVNCRYVFLYWVFLNDTLISLNYSAKDTDKGFELKPHQVQICWKTLYGKKCEEKLKELFEPIYWDGESFHGVLPSNRNLQIQPTFMGEVCQDPESEFMVNMMQDFKAEVKKERC